MTRTLIPSLIFVGAVLNTAIAQDPKLAEAFQRLQTTQQDTDKVNTYYAISRYYWDIDADSALLMGKKGLEIATRAGYKKGMALCHLTLGVAYGMQGLYPEALDNHLKALRLSEALSMEGLTGNNYTNIGIVYSDMKDYPRAIDYFRRALQISLHFHEKAGVAYSYINLGETFSDAGQLDSAIWYSKAALAIGEQINDTSALSAALDNLGDYTVRNGHAQAALPYLQRALVIAQKAHDENTVAAVHISLARAFTDLQEYRQSISLADQALREARKLHSDLYEKDAWHTLYRDYAGLRMLDKALDSRNREIAINDSIYTLDKEKQLHGLQTTYELERKQDQLDLANKDRLLKAGALARDKIQNYALGGALILLVLWATWLFRSNRRRQRMNRLLENRNQEIVRKNVELQDLNGVKNKLLSILGHDLRSPLTTLKSFVDLLKLSALRPDQIETFSKQMGESLESTSRLLDNLLFWTRSQMEGMEVNPKVFDILPLLELNEQLIRPRSEEKKVTLSVASQNTARTAPLLVYADEIMVDIVVRNLVDNALKFSRPGDTISVDATGTEKEVTVFVRDTGHGIAPESQHKIFKSINYTTSGTSKEKGSGLGLTLCKELVEKNGGAIHFASEPGKGTTFRFTLPAAAGVAVTG